MERRSFIKHAGLAGILASGSPPALAQRAPEVRWRMASSFPRSLDILFGAAETIGKRIASSTNNRFQFQVFAGGEIVPALGVIDAVQNATVQCGHTAASYLFGRDPAFALGCALPFGLNARQQNAWMYHGGGMELMREFYGDYNVINFPAGNTGARMGGWFRRPVRKVADLKGLRMRIGVTGALPLQRLGLVPKRVSGGDVQAAFAQGSLDAAESISPYDDEKLGLYKVAKYYCYPGWWESGPELDLFVNVAAYNDLPKEYRSALEAACYEANVDVLAQYDALNPAALKRLIANGAKLAPFPDAVMAACYKATAEVYDGIAAKNAKFGKIYDAWKKFRDDEVSWFGVAEDRFDAFMNATQRTPRHRVI